MGVFGRAMKGCGSNEWVLKDFLEGINIGKLS